jgi:excinuclease ABC subunit C
MDPLMNRLYPPSHFVDFGPATLQLETALAQLQRLEGHRSAVLRRGIREACPRCPGVYGMIDLHGDLVYVGKAKSLRARLQSYFRPRSRDRKAGQIIGQTRSLVWEASAHEFAALHRELELIRRWRPRFNVQGKPHQWQYTHVCLGRPPAPYAFLSCQPPRNVSAVFGPISAGRRAADAVRRLNDLFGLRDCPQSQTMIFADQAELFERELHPGCLRHELGTCLGPCAGACSRGDYTKQVRAAGAFLAGRDLTPLARLEQAMHEAAATENFERAATLRDKWKALAWLQRQLDHQRQANLMPTMLYPLTAHEGQPLCYVLHAGRAVAALPGDIGDHDPAAVRTLAAQRSRAGRLGDHVAGVLLLAAWFRKRPKEAERLVCVG